KDLNKLIAFINEKFDNPNTSIKTVYADNNNVLWISTNSNQLYGLMLNKLPYQRDLFTPKDMDSPRNKRIDIIFEDRFYPNVLWMGVASGGLKRINLISHRFFTNLFKTVTELSNPNITSLYGDTTNIWVGTEKGLLQFNADESHYYFYPLTNPENSNAKVSVNAIYKDRKENLWLATNNALYQLQGQGHSPHQLVPSPITKSEKTVNKIYQDSEHYLYFGTGKGFNILNPHTKMSLDSSFIPKGNQGKVLSLCRDEKDRLWVGTDKGLILMRNVKEPNKDIYKIKPEYFIHNSLDTNSLHSNIIISLHEDYKGNIWLGTGAGLVMIKDEKQKISFTHYTKNKVLTSHTVYSILEDSLKHHLWLGTNAGLYRFHLITHRFDNFDLYDGLQGNEFNQDAASKSPNGQMLFGGINGYTRFFADQIRADSISPKVWITEYTDKNGAKHDILYQKNKKIEVSYFDNSFLIHFIGVQYTGNAPTLRYAYQLTKSGDGGTDPRWTTSETSPQVPYSNLEPGNYTFRVTGITPEGIRYSNWDTLEITIHPPFWNTTWFYLMVMASIALILWLIHQYRVQQKIRRLTDMDRVRKNAAADFHDELGHKLTVISLFANVVKRTIGDNEKVAPHLEKIINTSNSLYLSMKDLLWVLDPKKDSLYDMSIMLKDFGDQLFDNSGIMFRVEGIHENMKPYNLIMDRKRHIALMFKEIMNNTIKHAKCQNTLLLFEWNEPEKALSISFKDDGRGLGENSVGKGNGLINLQDRANKIQGTMEFLSGNGLIGTTVVFKTVFEEMKIKPKNDVQLFFEMLYENIKYLPTFFKTETQRIWFRKLKPMLKKPKEQEEDEE
ncbi:MAG: ligand-binding sensor domain-containing protein, partial [Bacteroidales bacterium]